MNSESYFVRVGNWEGELALYRKQDGEITKIIDGLDDRINVNPFDIRVKVERLLGGYWPLWVDLLDGNDDFVNVTIEVEKTVKASIKIYDKKGFVIREICHSELITHKAN